MDTDFPNKPAPNPGSGVAKTAAASTPEKAPPPAPKPEEAVWSSQPSIADQRQVAPHSVRVHKYCVQTFELPAQEAQLNELMARCTPIGAPSVVIDQLKTETSDCGWKVLVMYSELQYRILAPETKR